MFGKFVAKSLKVIGHDEVTLYGDIKHTITQQHIGLTTVNPDLLKPKECQSIKRRSSAFPGMTTCRFCCEEVHVV